MIGGRRLNLFPNASLYTLPPLSSFPSLRSPATLRLLFPPGASSLFVYLAGRSGLLAKRFVIACAATFPSLWLYASLPGAPNRPLCSSFSPNRFANRRLSRSVWPHWLLNNILSKPQHDTGTRTLHEREDSVLVPVACVCLGNNIPAGPYTPPLWLSYSFTIASPGSR